MTTVRRLAVAAGRFYPADADALRAEVCQCVDNARPTCSAHRPPKAIIVPHASYRCSGPIAGSAYAHLEQIRDVVRRVVLLGPSHFAVFPGLATSSAVAFETPLGELPIDGNAVENLLQLPQVHTLDDAHAMEHSLEVQLPFLQIVLPDVKLVPLAIGRATTEEISEVIESIWDGPETLFVVSSDLSHYLDYASACRLDRMTAGRIEALDAEHLSGRAACGHRAIRGLLCVARRRGLTAETVDLRNSGDTTGQKAQVVGYGAFLLRG